jgi:hypothetical protein
MKQIYINYLEWEDYQNGMYETSNKIDKEKMIESCIDLLSNPEEFYSVCINLCKDWKNSTDVNLSNVMQNRKAWLGAAACCYKYNIPEFITRLAWSKIDCKNQYRANNVANKIIKEYERKYNGLYKNVGESLLF